MSASNGPQLSRVVWGKYGKYDLNRFDHLVQRGASLGNASIGKVHVDCKFLFRKSKWGVYTTGTESLVDQRPSGKHISPAPAGIIYLDLTFDQPKECRLKSATILVTLDDDDQGLKSLEARVPPGDRMPVQIMTYGPGHIFGESKHEFKKSKTHFTPSFGAAGMAEFGGVGKDTERAKLRECRWDFSAHKRTNSESKVNPWAYTVLSWHLTENELDAQPMHDNVVHTAFSFTYSGQPFFMKVEVTGTLESTRADLKQKFKSKLRKLKFPRSSLSKRYATTLIHIDDHANYNTPLDGLIMGLGRAMEAENGAGPIEYGARRNNGNAKTTTAAAWKARADPTDEGDVGKGPEVQEYDEPEQAEPSPPRPGQTLNAEGPPRPPDDRGSQTVENLAHISQHLLSMPSTSDRCRNNRRFRPPPPPADSTNDIGQGPFPSPRPAQSATTGWEYIDTTYAPSTPEHNGHEQADDPDISVFEVSTVHSYGTVRPDQSEKKMDREPALAGEHAPVHPADGDLYHTLVLWIQMWVAHVLLNLVNADNAGFSAA